MACSWPNEGCRWVRIGRSERAHLGNGSLKCLTTAVKGHTLLSVHGMTQQLLYIKVIWTGISFFFFFSVVNFGNWGKLGDIGAAWGPPGDREPYIVATQQSTYVNAVGDGGWWNMYNAIVTLPIPSDQGWDVPRNNFKHLIFCTGPPDNQRVDW